MQSSVEQTEDAIDNAVNYCIFPGQRPDLQLTHYIYRANDPCPPIHPSGNIWTMNCSFVYISRKLLPEFVMFFRHLPHLPPK